MEFDFYEIHETMFFLGCDFEEALAWLRFQAEMDSKKVPEDA